MKKLFVLFGLTLMLAVPVCAQNEIHKVDFKNFTYQPDFCGGGDGEAEQRDITVKDGEYSEETKVGEGEDEYFERLYFNIFDIAYGDLDGDRQDEAVIVSLCNTGGTGNFTEAYIYKMQDGKPKRVMLLTGGDRADGGLRETRVENGLLIVESNGAGELGGACCPEFIITNTYKFDGENLREVGREQRREIYPAARISFDRGKTSKIVSVKLNSEDGIKRFVVGASAGQILIVTKTPVDAFISLRRGEAEVVQEGESLVAKLNETGDFIFEISISYQQNLDFPITITIKNAEPSDGKIESIYTDLNAEKCRTVELDEQGAGYYRGECDGVGGYKLEVIEGDIRQTINVINSESEKSELELWSVVSGGFSAVGEKAEWRVKSSAGKTEPIALIVRFNVNEDPENHEKVTSYLVVSRIGTAGACVTDIVRPMSGQNEKARELADIATSKPCLTSR